MALASPGTWRTSTAGLKVTAMRSGTEVLNAPGRGRVREMGDSGSDPAPHGRPVVVAGGHELVRSGGTFLERLVAIALEHQLCGLPNVDLRDHALKLHPYGQ